MSKKVVYTYGAFDLFHAGHVALLEDAKKLGDILIVGLFPDDVVESFKRKPIVPFHLRKKVLEYVKIVDEIVVQDSRFPYDNIKGMKPDIVAKGPGAGWEDIYKAVGEMFDVKTILLNYHEGISTSEIIKKIKES